MLNKYTQPTNSEPTEEICSDEAGKLIVQSLAKIDGLALGVALGTLCGIGIFLATNILILKGGDVIGPTLALLSQYFVGFEVSYRGSIIGLCYGLIVGFVTGWLIALLRNIVLMVYVHLIRLKGSINAVNDYIDNP
ncbi:MAG: hypothetical protein AB7V18_04055 [Pyrinomonadaceae bacterium]